MWSVRTFPDPYYTNIILMIHWCIAGVCK